MEQKRSWKERIGVVLLSFVAAGGSAAGVQAWRHYQARNDYTAAGFPSQRSFDAFKREWARVEALPQYAEWRRGKGANGTKESYAQLAAGGISRLPDQELLQRAKILVEVMDNLSSGACARMFTGDISGQESYRSVIDAVEHSKEPNAIDAWARISADAAIANLLSYPVPVISEQEISRQLGAVFARLPDAERESIYALVTHPSSLTDRQKCDSGIALYETLIGASSPAREIGLRAVMMD
ncbi:hypothetical protein [Bordetella flabilis]|uniref:Uncharacterized protein n=1 Tax=Bordetella flabilis TaxID=463014 RepID=A0A193GC18_9BORD|nr:hypothetical protein [Bordetella flabilis]ANN76819.1 hypothetical protein BAU07_06550 [Bordetella flabilis]